VPTVCLFPVSFQSEPTRFSTNTKHQRSTLNTTVSDFQKSLPVANLVTLIHTEKHFKNSARAKLLQWIKLLYAVKSEKWWTLTRLQINYSEQNMTVKHNGHKQIR